MRVHKPRSAESGVRKAGFRTIRAVVVVLGVLALLAQGTLAPVHHVARVAAESRFLADLNASLCSAAEVADGAGRGATPDDHGAGAVGFDCPICKNSQPYAGLIPTQSSSLVFDGRYGLRGGLADGPHAVGRFNPAARPRAPPPVV